MSLSRSIFEAPPPPPAPVPTGGRVAAGVLDNQSSFAEDSIPLRILLLLMDEVFNLKQRNLWFRRRMVAFLQQIVRATFGGSINRKIRDFVGWLTSEEQVVEYL